jgi:hypothetical protein
MIDQYHFTNIVKLAILLVVKKAYKTLTTFKALFFFMTMACILVWAATFCCSPLGTLTTLKSEDFSAVEQLQVTEPICWAEKTIEYVHVMMTCGLR